MQEFHTKDRSLYKSYGRFLRDKFGCKVYKISVDAGFLCPNRDGKISTGGCTYCNNDSFRAKSANPLKSVLEQIQDGMEYLRKRYGAEKFIAYFQPFTNTYAPLERLIPLYEAAVVHPDVVGLSIGTRPDCIDEGKIAWLEQLARTHFVTLEYGLQSAYDETLKRINRGHDFRCWQTAMALTRDRGIWLGAHLILGFPWETRAEMLNEAAIVSNEGVQFLKLHQLHVVKNSTLAKEYLENPFPLPGLEEYADLVAEFIQHLGPQVYLERLFATAPEDQLIAPVWGKSKAEIQHFIERRIALSRGQSAVGSRQSAVGSRQSAVGSRQSAVGSKKIIC